MKEIDVTVGAGAAVSVPEKGAAMRNTEPAFATGSSGFTSTMRPVLHVVAPEQVRLSAVTHTVTGMPCLMASERAYCRSPTRPLTSVEIRYFVTLDWYEGTAIESRIAAIETTTISSTKVKPLHGSALRPLAVDLRSSRLSYSVINTVDTSRRKEPASLGAAPVRVLVRAADHALDGISTAPAQA
ncbi:hypothetical protein SBBP2_250007 [Burkholderiales bacterium]|nr:hypothetical protein SBBP2_250007 [Burkholderiales bacterium]